MAKKVRPQSTTDTNAPSTARKKNARTSKHATARKDKPASKKPAVRLEGKGSAKKVKKEKGSSFEKEAIELAGYFRTASPTLSEHIHRLTVATGKHGTKLSAKSRAAFASVARDMRELSRSFKKLSTYKGK